MGDQCDGHRLALPLDPEAVVPPGHEDMSSDSSADVTASDSGRGASDTEDAPTTAGAPRQSGPVYGSASSSLDSAPWVPPRQPMGVAMRGSGADPPTYRDVVGRDTSGPDNLSRAARAYASQKDFHKPRRPAGKVRFSVDDQLVGQGREPGQVYWTGEARTPNLTSFTGNPAHHRESPALGSSHKPPTGANLNLASHPYYPSHNSDSRRSPLQQTAQNSSSSQPDLFKSLASSHAGGIPRHQPKPALSGRPAGPPNPSFPLLPHQKYLTSNPASNRGLLPPMNASIDEDEDDGSTTTSGSYAVEDNILNISVEC
ncbi:hypothetical protein EGW08_015413 [Elysia chlorotica]|uniref:Uncharacterized protein n=1 Tax=Elysia chlorotica TaxID=188477 RepID=A0A3S1BWP2_ELYCH|nr:hypothetical protein EGW08_015413 [Elysia chlorotica]